MGLPAGPLRPNTAKIERQGVGGTSNAGDRLPANPTTVCDGLVCMIGPESLLGTRASLGGGATGPTVDSLYVLIADAVPANGNAPGSSFAIAGVTYIVHRNGRDAFPDIRHNDRVTRDDGAEFLVVGPPSQYTAVTPNVQAHLVFGKAWG